MLTYILFVIGFIVLIKGADLLVDGSASIANKLNISSLVIGLTIVSFGTSSPEFVVNIIASTKGNSGLAIGNILGSNIANILLILGVSSIVYPLVTKKNTVAKEIPFSLLAVLLVGILVNDAFIDGSTFSGLTRIDGIVLLTFFIIFLYYTFDISKASDDETDVNIKQLGNFKSFLFIMGGLIGLILGGKWIVDGAVKIAELFNVSQKLIGLTIVAIGTSLPELATSVVAAYKKQTDIAVGNVVGSNIFNIFWILGFSALIRPIPFSRDTNADILMVIVSSLILFIILFVGKKRTIEKWEGIVMVLIYIGYILFSIFSK